MTGKVIHIVAAPASGGIESLVRDLCPALKPLGWTAHIAFISSAADIGRDAAFERAYLAQLDMAGIGYSFLGHKCRRKPWLGIQRLRRLVREFGADVIHSHLAYGVVYGLSSPRIPLVYTHHSEQARYGRLAYALLRRRVAAWVGISSRCVMALEPRAGQAVHLIRNGVDLSRFRDQPNSAPSACEPLRAIAVGRLAPQKDYETMARALADVNGAGPHRIVVQILGEGDPAIIEQCDRILTVSGAHGSMAFAGVTADVPAALAKADLFLMSSAWEGLPVALIEATASGLPAIVTDVGGCREVIEACSSGIVVPLGDAIAFAGAIQALLDDRPRLLQMAEQARQCASAFSIEATAQAHASLYDELMA